MIPGLDEGISKMEAGQSAQIHVPATHAFGERLSDLVRVMSEKELERTGLRPRQGMILNIDGVQARVKSVSSGRAVLDFNHPLAGLDLTYHVNLLDVITEPEAKAKALGDEYSTSLRIERAPDKAVIWIPKLLEAGRARGLAAQLGASVGTWADVKIES
jgi:FKBP-type peptidyl-prolyl cis-trans isomerase 2